MIKPLTKRRSNNGELYSRPPEVEENIKSAFGLGIKGVRDRLKEPDPNTQEYLKSECLVYLFRAARDKGDDAMCNLLAAALLNRCEGILLSRLPRESAQLVDDILGEFACLLANDSNQQLDFYECRFNRAFRTHWIGIVRTETKRCQKLETRTFGSTTTESDDEETDPDEPRCEPTESDHVLRSEMLERLPPKIRKAVVLREMGYEIKVVAKRCDVTERTIHNWLDRAKEIVVPNPSKESA